MSTSVNLPTPRVVLKRVPVKGSIEDAISAFYEVLKELRDEIQEVVDGAEGGRAETQRMQTLADTASELDQIADNEQDVPTGPDGAPEPGNVSWTENHRRGISRSDRRDNGVNAAEAAISGLNDMIESVEAALGDLDEENPEDEEQIQELDNFKDELSSILTTLEEDKDAAESLEFPGR